MAKSKKTKKSKKPAAAKKNVSLEKDEEVEAKSLSLEKTEDESEKKSEKKESAKESKKEEKKSDKKSDKKDEKKPSAFAKIAKYFRECRSEVKKIVWPTPKATFKNVGIVLSVLLVVGLFVYALDTGFIALLKLVMDI